MSPGNKPILDLSQYYTAGEAAAVLSRNSKKDIKPAYVRKLALYGILTPLKINDRYNLYPKAEVDAYRVEERGAKLEHRREARAKQSKEAA
jgi:hypothetical protein